MARVFCFPIDLSRYLDGLSVPLVDSPFFDYKFVGIRGQSLEVGVRQSAEAEADERGLVVFEYFLPVDGGGAVAKDLQGRVSYGLFGLVLAKSEADLRSRFAVHFVMGS